VTEESTEELAPAADQPADKTVEKPAERVRARDSHDARQPAAELPVIHDGLRVHVGEAEQRDIEFFV